MTAVDLLTTWASMSPLERASVREVYFRDRSMAETARRCRTTVVDVSRALQSAYRRVAAFVLDPDADHAPTLSPDRTASALRRLSELPTATWHWDTAREEMRWSDEMFQLYGYPLHAVPPTIGRHQSHKHADDRATAERLVLTSATEDGPVVFPQRVIRTDGSVCRVIMRVVREPGLEEILTGWVVTDLASSA